MSGKVPTVRKLMLGGTVALALTAGACGSKAETPTHPVRPVTTAAFPIPPNWHALPTAPTNGTPGQVCFNGECFKVDGNGMPYGTPEWEARN